MRFALENCHSILGLMLWRISCFAGLYSTWNSNEVGTNLSCYREVIKVLLLCEYVWNFNWQWVVWVVYYHYCYPNIFSSQFKYDIEDSPVLFSILHCMYVLWVYKKFVLYIISLYFYDISVHLYNFNSIFIRESHNIIGNLKSY